MSSSIKSTSFKAFVQSMLTIKVTGVFSHPSCFFCLSNLWKQQIQFSIVASERATYGRIAEKCDRIVNCNWESSRVNNKKVRLSYFAFFYRLTKSFLLLLSQFCPQMRICHTNRFLYFLGERKKRGRQSNFQGFCHPCYRSECKKSESSFWR